MAVPDPVFSGKCREKVNLHLMSCLTFLSRCILLPHPQLVSPAKEDPDESNVERLELGVTGWLPASKNQGRITWAFPTSTQTVPYRVGAEEE